MSPSVRWKIFGACTTMWALPATSRQDLTTVFSRSGNKIAVILCFYKIQFAPGGHLPWLGGWEKRTRGQMDHQLGQVLLKWFRLFTIGLYQAAAWRCSGHALAWNPDISDRGTGRGAENLYKILANRTIFLLQIRCMQRKSTELLWICVLRGINWG